MNETYLVHYGVKGMKWGVRRYQNSDGTLTARGKIHAKTSSPEFKSKVKKGAMITSAVVAAYATHKIINDPRAIAVGAKAVKSTISAVGKIKTSAMNTSEYKIAKAAVKAGSKATAYATAVSGTTVGRAAKDALRVGATGGMIYGIERAVDKRFGEDASRKVVKYGREPRKK